MTSIQQNYYNYLETVKHNREMERQGLMDLEVSKYKAETDRRRQQVDAQYSAAQIKQIANNIRQRDIELAMSNDMNNWKKSVDSFNNDIRAQEQSLAQTRQDFEREKFNQGQSNWWKEYDQKQGQYNLAKKEYELAVKKFENDKTQATWSNVLKTADTAANIINTLTKARSVSLSDFAKLAAKAGAKAAAK